MADKFGIGSLRPDTQRAFVREVERAGKDPVHWVRREASFALGALAKVVPEELIILSLVTFILISFHIQAYTRGEPASFVRILEIGFGVACPPFFAVRPPRCPLSSIATPEAVYRSFDCHPALQG